MNMDPCLPNFFFKIYVACVYGAFICCSVMHQTISCSN